MRPAVWWWSLLCAAAAQAQPAFVKQVPAPVGREGYSVVLENDLLSGGTDRWYTNGLHYAAAYRQGNEPGLLKPVVELGRRSLHVAQCPAGASEKCELLATVGLGQTIYTPRHVDLASPQLRDRPWAGWLYVGMGLSSYRGKVHHMAALKLGPTGPASLAEPAQASVHRYISHSPRPEGWAHQVRPRLGVQLSYQATYRYRLFELLGAHASLGGAAGNVKTYARAGLGLNWSAVGGETGRHQPGTLDEGEFLVPDHVSSAPINGLGAALRHTVVYAHTHWTGVAYNVFLQGNTYAGRPQIEPLRNVFTTTVGVTVPLGRHGQHRLGLALKRRSPEFAVRGEVARDAYQRWGVLSYSHDFDPAR